jgi:hypothetical protein
MLNERSRRDELLRTLSLEELASVVPLSEEAIDAALERGARERAQATKRWRIVLPGLRF